MKHPPSSTPPAPLTGGDAVHSPSPRAALASLSLAVLLSSLGISVANVGLPTFARVFAASFQEVQWIVLAYLLASTSLIVGAGRLGDLLGRRRLMLAGIAVFSFASILSAAAPTLGILVGARALQGLGAAVMMALALALVGQTVTKEKTGHAMGLLGTMSAIGTALGPSLGGVLLATLGWRALFLFQAILGGVTWALALRHLPADVEARARHERPRFDIAGTALLALALVAYALAMTIGRHRSGLFNLSWLLIALIVGGVFIRHQARSKSPLVELAFFRQRRLGAGLIASAFVAVVVMATLVVGPFFLSGTLGLNPATLGIVMSTGPLVAALTGVPAGRLVDRLGARAISLWGLAGVVAGCAAFCVGPIVPGIAGYVAPLVITTAGYALFQAANNAMVMTSVDTRARGVVSGVLNLARNLGLITGASLMGAVFAWGAGADDVSRAGPEATVAGLRMTFTVATALSLLAFAVVLKSETRKSGAPSRVADPA